MNNIVLSCMIKIYEHKVHKKYAFQKITTKPTHILLKSMEL